MRYAILICTIVLLSACSMAPNQNVQHSNSIRIIKEQPKRYVHEQKYNTKIEQVDYNSSIIEPELDKGNRKIIRKKKKVYGKKLTSRVTGKVSSTKNQVENRASSVMNKTIDRKINSLFR